MPSEAVFIAYPAEPTALGSTILAAVELVKGTGRSFVTWSALDIPGRFLSDGILDQIDQAAFVVADITRLNFNVTFEFGYALGRSKRVVPIVNSALQPETKDLAKLGLFDTIGYRNYTNAGELATILRSVQDIVPTQFPSVTIEQKAPIYVLDTLHKTDAALRITSKIKKARIRFRSFDPAEQPRLSALDAYVGVAASAATVIHLLSSDATDQRFNNQRGAFIAGLSLGLRRHTLILQEAPGIVPLDYRDFASTYRSPADIEPFINELIPRVTDSLFNLGEQGATPQTGLIAEIDLGAPAAENEAVHLGRYYVPTDHYTQTLSGKVRLAVGRKGSGKTALFFQVRDKVRSDRKVVVLDLKPEGHQLKRFKDVVLEWVDEATKENLASAFWEYVLLLELCHKILEKDREGHVHDHTIYKPYRRLSDLYDTDGLISEGDFSERINGLVQRIVDDFRARPEPRTPSGLQARDVVQLIYKHDMRQLRAELASYLKLKRGAWILFDNIDKGWPTRGVEQSDVIQLRGLLDATRTIERLFRREDVDVKTVVFLRNDVFEILVDQTPDRGKESRVNLDWTDADLLRELFRRRFAFSKKVPLDKISFDSAWKQLFVSHIDGEETSEYLIDRSLMRPRNFLNLLTHCKSIAVNLRHQKVEPEDIVKALKVYSADIGHELDLEIRDVFPDADELLYHFLGVPSRLTLRELRAHLSQTKVPLGRQQDLIQILLWFGFIGVVRKDDPEQTETYAWSVFYDMKKLRHIAKDFSDEGVTFAINRAFWPFLEIQ